MGVQEGRCVVFNNEELLHRMELLEHKVQDVDGDDNAQALPPSSQKKKRKISVVQSSASRQEGPLQSIKRRKQWRDGKVVPLKAEVKAEISVPSIPISHDDPSSSEKETLEARRTILCFFLVNPKRRIKSTSDVPIMHYAYQAKFFISERSSVLS